MEEHVPCLENSQRRIKAGIQERKDRIKTLLKEEFPQKLMGKIDKIGGSQGKIDRYISRITGIEIKIISTARAWHKILKEKIRKRDKTAVEILLGENQITPQRSIQEENSDKEKIENHLQTQKNQEMSIEILTESSHEVPKDEILSECEEVPLGTSQLEINCTKEYWKKQVEHAVSTYKETRGTSLEDSEWAPNENTCEGQGEFRAKIAAFSLPGKSKEERIKFVRGTIYKNCHISTIEESFIKGNSWVVITFDCLKGRQIMEEKLKKKEIEWYKVIFEETNSNITTTKDIDYESNKKTQIKGKNKDFTWITL